MTKRSCLNPQFPLVIAGALLLAVSVSNAQDKPPAAKIDPNLNEREDAYLNRQAEAFLKQAQRALMKFPPQYPEPNERFQALLLLDAVLHDVHAAKRPPVQKFFHARMEAALKEIETTRVEDGAMIWKLYNMGFIVRTKTVTVAFDLVRGDSARCRDFALPAGVMERFVNQCDALFISHRHVTTWMKRWRRGSLSRANPSWPRRRFGRTNPSTNPSRASNAKRTRSRPCASRTEAAN